MPEQSPEIVVRARILAVTDYLNRVQQKYQPTRIKNGLGGNVSFWREVADRGHIRSSG